MSESSWLKTVKKNYRHCTNDSCLNFIEENDRVLVVGFGHKGHAVGDIPRVHIKVANVSLLLYAKARRKDQDYKFSWWNQGSYKFLYGKKSTIFLYISNEHVDTKDKNTILCIIVKK